MNASALKGEFGMTDMQFKSIMELVAQILDRSKDIDDARRAIYSVIGKTDSEEKAKAKD